MSWTVKQLSDLGRIVTGKTPLTNEPKFFDGEYLFITPSDLNFNHYYCYSTEKTVTTEAKSKHKNQFITADSILFTCIGNTIGKAAIAPSECLTNQQINSIIANEDNDFKFIYYLLLNNVEAIKSLGSGAATPIINKTSFGQIQFAVPALDVQKRISRILSAYDDLIDNNRKRIALLEKAARLLYEEWFVRLQFPGHEHTPVVDGVPEGWKRKSVEDIGAVITGKTPDTTRASYYGEDVPFIKTPDMHGNVYVIETESSLSREGADVQPKKYLPKNAILVACIGAKLGVVSLSPGVSQTNQQINAVVVHNSAATYFAFFTLRDFKPRLEAIGGGATMPNVNKSKFGSLDFLLPSKALLQAFDEFCKPVFAQIMTLQQQNRKLQAARDLLLPRLMSGKLAV